MRAWRNVSILLLGSLAAAGLGYWVSSVVGIQILTREIETQLSSILAGSVRIERVGLAIQRGLFIQGESIEVYPDSTAILGSRLSAKRVVAEIDLLALATGRFRLSGLILEEPTLDIRRDSEGNWYPFPVQALADINSKNRSSDPELYVHFFSSFENVTRILLKKPIAADRVELRNGRVLFRDEKRSNPIDAEMPVILSMNEVEGVLIHHWLSGESQLKLSAKLLTGADRETHVEVVGENNGDDEYRSRITANAFPLETLDPYLAKGEVSGWPHGSLVGSIDYKTDSPKTGLLAADWTILRFQRLNPQGPEKRPIEREKVRLAAVGRLDEDTVRLTGTVVDDSGIKLGLDGEVSRPLSDSSPTQMSADFAGLNVDALEEFFGPLNFEAQGQRMELKAGSAKNFGLSGDLGLDGWQQLYSGQLSPLPDTVRVSGELVGLEISSEQGDIFTELAGRVDLWGDTFRLRRGRGIRNGEPLPALDISIKGVSNVFKVTTRESARGTEPSSFPGLDPLMEILGIRLLGAEDPKSSRAIASSRSGPTETAAPNSEEERTILPFRIWIDQLEHPSLPCIVREADFLIAPDPTKIQIEAKSMLFGGVPLTGKLIWKTTPKKQIELVMQAAPPTLSADAPQRDQKRDSPSVPAANKTGSPVPTAENASETNDQPPPVVPWLSGRIEIPGLETGLLPLQAVEADFAMLGASLFLSHFRANLEPRGTLGGNIELNLSRRNTVPVALTFSLENADMSRVGELFGIRPGDITGTLDISGSLEGSLQPEQSLLTDLAGKAEVNARQGALGRQEIPVLLALAQASEGYNNYADEAAIPYESMTADMNLKDHRVQTRNFELEGPLRIYASGSLDVVTPPYDLIGVAGLFLFRGAGQLFESIPLVKVILPGSERGLVGTYYQVDGDLSRPQVRSLPGRSFAEGLPDLLEAPYQILRA
ncbi:MAG TPA: hypothetical protein EYQ54_07180, partial [Myxococcales bacterium]|nr:hypothetical protein [Myxococcales bacterium]